MNTGERRNEIISILIYRRQITVRELATEFDVTMRTIQNDIQALSLGYPIYTKPGGGGGVFLKESYRPYVNTLSVTELELLHNLYDAAEKKEKEILARILRKYGPSGYRF